MIRSNYILLLVIICSCTFTACNSADEARETSLEQENADLEGETIWVYAEKMPEFPGGLEKMHDFIALNLNYPKKALDAEVAGRVYVEFIVDKSGAIRNPRVIKGIGYGCNAEAIRIIHAMPKWKPGTYDGQTVHVFYRAPILFNIGRHLNPNKD